MMAAQQGVEHVVVGQAVHVEVGGVETPVLTAIFDAYDPLPARDLQLGGTVHRLDPSVDDERHPVAQFVGGRHVVGGQEDCATARLQTQDDVLDLARVYRVQARRRFIEEQQFGVVDQGSREGQPHLHSL